MNYSRGFILKISLIGTLTLKNRSVVTVHAKVQFIKPFYIIQHIISEHDRRIKNGQFSFVAESGMVKGIEVAFVAYAPTANEERIFDQEESRNSFVTF